MIDDSKPKKKTFLEQPFFYFICVVAAIPLGFLHYQHDKKRYSPDEEYAQAIDKIKEENKAFLEKLKQNECYAVNVVQRFENSMNRVVTGNELHQIPARTRIKPVNYIIADGKSYRIQSYGITPTYTIHYFSKNVEYRCLKGGYNYSTPYYFRSIDFKELSDFTQIELAPKLSAVTSNKTLNQAMFDMCVEGKSVLLNKPCKNGY